MVREVEVHLGSEGPGVKAIRALQGGDVVLSQLVEAVIRPVVQFHSYPLFFRSVNPSAFWPVIALVMVGDSLRAHLARSGVLG